jgi:hypothetical protein
VKRLKELEPENSRLRKAVYTCPLVAVQNNGARAPPRLP